MLLQEATSDEIYHELVKRNDAFILAYKPKASEDVEFATTYGGDPLQVIGLSKCIETTMEDLIIALTGGDEEESNEGGYDLA